MSANPHLRRVLGEAEEPEPARLDPSIDELPKGAAASDPARVAKVEELVNLWKNGSHIDVATKLMFTEASYVDFVDICFAIGQEQGRMLGGLLDELAESENIEVPKPSKAFTSILQRSEANRSSDSMEPV